MAGAHIHIYSPRHWLGRSITYCTTCKANTRHLWKFYEWHPSRHCCGRCGYEWVNGDGRQRLGMKERKRHMDEVRNNWDKAQSRAEAARMMCEDIFQKDLWNKNGEPDVVDELVEQLPEKRKRGGTHKAIT